MILQCDQCSTRFRLDDSKLKPGGVKVRCSKCRHVFLAAAEQKEEDSEFDAILSGLGAPAPEKQQVAQPVRQVAVERGFAEEPAAGHEVPASDAATPHVTAQPEISDFAGFDLPAGPSALQDKTAPVEQPAPLPKDLPDFSDIDFGTEPAMPQEAQTTTAFQGHEYGEFDFEDEPAALKDAPVPAQDEAFVFGKFPGAAEPDLEMEEPVSAAPGEGLDFGDFDFNAGPVVKPPEPQTALDELDFGEFSFAEEPAVTYEEPSAAKEAFDFDEFSFAEEPPLIEETPVADVSDNFGSLPFSEELQQRQGESAGAAGLGELSLPHDFLQKEAPAAAEQAKSAGAVAPAYAGRPAPAPLPVSPLTDAEKPSVQEATLSHGFAAKPVPKPAPEEGVADEEITSRRKGRSVLAVSIVAVSVLVIFALSGAGLYLLQSGPAAFETFDKLGLGFVAKWFGVESLEEGRITIRNPLAAFHQNKEAGEIFVITGEAVNSYKKARASIRVKVSLFDKNGATLLQKTAYCGNRLSDEQLATLPMAKIESIMNNQFGDSLSNLGVKPGQAIGFVVAIANVPKDAVDFGVVVVGSTVAGQ